MTYIQWLEHRVPPPLVAVVIGAVMWGTAQLGPLLEISPAFHIAAVATIASIGVGFNVAGMLAFQRARTTLNPVDPEKASTLVTTGVYRITRNPMYLGGAIMLVAWAVYLASAWALLGVMLFVLYITKLQILPEERALSVLFGSRFDAYRAQVRRWL